MSALEKEIIEKFQRLEPDAKQRVLQTLAVHVQSSFDYDVWWAEVEALQADIRASHGDKLPPLDVVGMLRDIREGEDE